MAASYQRIPLSASTNFLPINIVGITSGSPTSLHTAHATNIDELWLGAYNYSGSDAYLYLLLGGSSASQILTVPIPALIGIVPILNGQSFTGGVEIKGYSDTANIISVVGYTNRIVLV